ncbi:pilus assembly protein PilO [Bacillus methanolicus]|uniref:type 4a pilus biogenesis protein PilO n=1 Tax=Bacillus methanolicus TaxID=1471 RepID=UPI0023807567|nr:pilus assembly protein PilO [Bacillus methanolicus]MDE3839774.1 pilus assembly protein PilO [Bacillus methanolicus]
MNLHLSKKQILLIILIFFLFITIFAGSYYLFLAPLKQKIDRNKSELKMLNQQTAIIESRLSQIKEETVVSTMELQKQVPVKRLLDQLLLDIEKAEIVSDTYISEIRLNGTEVDETIESTGDDSQDTAENNADANNNEQNNEANKEENNEATSSNEDATLPNGIKQTTITIKGEADTYFEMEKFIDSLQSLQRIVKVENLSFTAPKEIYKVDQDQKPIEFEITIAAYYYPKLEDLQKELPPLDTPRISNKKNPFSGFSDVDKDEKNNKDGQP